MTDKNLLIEREEPISRNIPRELRKQCVCWRLDKDESGKFVKVPYDCKTGRRAKTNDPKTWGTYEQALKAFDENPSYFGIGFVFSADDPYSGVDLDNCRDPKTGVLSPVAQEIVEKIDSYTEVSPSGTGVKIWAKGKPPGSEHKKGDFEIYDSKRFFVLTGNTLNGYSTIRKCREEVAWFYKKFILSGGEKESSQDKLKRILEGVRDGDRNDALKFLVGHFISIGLGDDEIIARLLEWDEKNLDKNGKHKLPLGKDVIERCLKNIRERDDKKLVVCSEDHLTDLGNAQRLIKSYGPDLRFCYPWDRWLIWDEKRWVKDETGEIDRLGKKVVQQMYKDAIEKEDREERKLLVNFALKCESESRLNAMAKLARSEPGVPILTDDLDQDVWLLNVLNGTIDLRTGELGHHRREDHITKIIKTEYLPEAECPFWLGHLKKIMGENQSLVDFLQKALGYSLTGNTDERVFFILWGEAFNGKTVTVETITELLGDYALAVPTDTLFMKRNESIPNDIARLKGIRFASCSEGEKNRRLAEALIKKMTGGNKQTARFLFCEWFDFIPSYKLFFETNHKPKVNPDDQAVWDRVRLIPFNVRISEEERVRKEELMDRFRKEYPGILAWMVKGCLLWQKEGLGIPVEVREATEEYRKEQDYLSDFIKENCQLGAKKTILVDHLYHIFRRWMEHTEIDTPSERVFTMKMKALGYKSRKITSGEHRNKYEWAGLDTGF